MRAKTHLRHGLVIQKFLHLGTETHVQHTIGFVQYNELDRIEAEYVTVEEIAQTAGRSN